MPIFLDTGSVEEVERFLRLGVIRGVTTNPTILLRHRESGGGRSLETLSKDLARLIAPLPLSVEVGTAERVKAIEQGLTLASWAENIVVKVTIHGPDGEPETLEAVHELETKHDVRVNVTAVMSAQQGLLASLAGATYVSIFGGRVNNMGYNVRTEITKLRTVLDRFGLASRIIVGSTREVLNVIEWLEAGAHVVTVVPDLLTGMLVHPYSKETVRMFLEDASRLDALP